MTLINEVADRPVAAWQNFYVIIGSASAALVGLQFVVMALVADLRRQTSKATISAFGTPTVMHFAGGLLVAAVMSAPWESLVAISIALGVCAAAGFAYAIAVTHRARHQNDYAPVGEDWLWYVILPCCLYAALVAAALFLPQHAHGGLFVVGGVALAMLLIGIRNAWDTVTYIVTGGPQGEGDGARHDAMIAEL